MLAVHVVAGGILGAEILFGITVWGGAWLAGDRTRLRRERMAELEERALRAEREAERERRLAAAEERARIARDLHDSAGHAINVILVHAGVGRLRPSATRAGARGVRHDRGGGARDRRRDRPDGPGAPRGRLAPRRGRAACGPGVAGGAGRAPARVRARRDELHLRRAAAAARRRRPRRLPDHPGGADERRPPRERQRPGAGRLRRARRRGLRGERPRAGPAGSLRGRRPRAGGNARAGGAARRQPGGGPREGRFEVRARLPIPEDHA